MASIINTSVTIGGREITRFSDFQLKQSIYDHHRFRLICPAEAIDGTQGVMFNSSKDLIGKDIVVEADTIEGTVGLRFAGIVTGVSRTRYSGHSGDVVISGYSPTILMDSGPHCKSWSQQALKNIAQDVLRHFPQNVLNPRIQPRSHDTFAYTVQYKETAWYFLKRLCAENGEWLYYEGETLYVGKQSEQLVPLVFGSHIEDFNVGLSVRPASMQAMSYDYTNTAVYSSSPQGIVQKAGLDEMGRHIYEVSKAMYATTPKTWNNRFHSSQKQLDDQVNIHSAIESSNMVRFHGKGNHPGVKLGGRISVNGNNIYTMAPEDYGSYTIVEVTHSIGDNCSYTNTFEAIPDTVQLPPVEPVDMIRCETQSALVTDNNDPQGLGRIRVKFHWMNGSERTPWIRVTSPHGGGGKGMFFIPEIGEEVIVGFESDSAVKPYVIGTVYHSKANNSFSNAGNDVKALQTRSGNKVVMNDKDGSVLISDKGGANSLMDGAGNMITNVNANRTLNAGNSHVVNVGAKEDAPPQSVLQMDAEGNIVIDGKTSITLKVGGNSITITNDSITTLSEKGDITNVTQEGAMAIAALSGMLSLQSSGGNMLISTDSELNIKGGPSAVIESSDTNIM